jgi:hypothetical protein
MKAFEEMSKLTATVSHDAHVLAKFLSDTQIPI